jgi:hypothetical protein
MTRSRRAGLAELLFARDADGRDLFVPWWPFRGSAYLVPDEPARERLRQQLVRFSLTVFVVVVAVGGTRQILGASALWDGLLVALCLAAYALRIRLSTRGLARTPAPRGVHSLSKRIAALGAGLRGWRLWAQIAATVLGIGISVNIIRTGIGASPAVGWLALAVCTFGFVIFAWAAWSDRRSPSR